MDRRTTAQEDMSLVLMGFVLIWTSGLQTHGADIFEGIDEIRLEGGSSRCSGLLKVSCRGVWTEVSVHLSNWDLTLADAVCRRLDCGSVVQTLSKSTLESVYGPKSICFKGPDLRKRSRRAVVRPTSVELICSDSVRLVNGTSLCSGSLEVKSNQTWSSVCQEDFDLQDAEATCRELGCGAPSVLKGALYGALEAPVWTKDFQCTGNESALLDCDSTHPLRTTCSSGKAVGLTCSEPDNLRLVQGSSRCAGELTVKQQGQWMEVDAEGSEWNLTAADAVCRQLDCGFAVSTEKKPDGFYKYLWLIRPGCLQLGSPVRECVFSKMGTSFDNLVITCSGKLARPNISITAHIDGVSEAMQQGLRVLMGSGFTVSCSVQPQYPGGSFQLIRTTSSGSQNYTLPAVNHSAHFLFSAAGHAHQGEYRCVYHIYVFSQTLSSESRTLLLTVSAPMRGLTVTVSVVTTVVLITALFLLGKVIRGRRRRTQLVPYSGAEELLVKEAQEPEQDLE